MKKRRTLKIIIMSAIMVILIPATAFAYPMNNDWSTNQWVGWRFQTSGNMVKCVQLMMNAANLNAGDVDGYYGNNTEGAIMRYQQARGLSADGTVGTNTWINMKLYVYRIGPGAKKNPLTGQDGRTDNYTWSPPGATNQYKVGFVKWIDMGNWEVMDQYGTSYPLY